MLFAHPRSDKTCQEVTQDALRHLSTFLGAEKNRQKSPKRVKTDFMPQSPESEILAIFFADNGEKCGEKMAKCFADFRPSISRKSGRKKFHEKMATNSAGRGIKFFHRETLGVWGHNRLRLSLKWLSCGTNFLAPGTDEKQSCKPVPPKFRGCHFTP